MNYSTLKEAYDIDTFEKKPKNKSSSKKVKIEEFEEEEEPKIKSSKKESKDIRDVKVKDPREAREYIKDKKNQSNKVQPYYDKDLEQYLNMNEFDNIIDYNINDDNVSDSSSSELSTSINSVEQPKQYNNTNEIDKKPVATASTAVIAKDYSSKKKDIYYKNIINICLFIFIGIIIIFICDQITEIAINIGMKNTIKLLEPYMNK